MTVKFQTSFLKKKRASTASDETTTTRDGRGNATVVWRRLVEWRRQTGYGTVQRYDTATAAAVIGKRTRMLFVCTHA